MSIFRVMLETLPPAGAVVGLPASQAHHLAHVRRLAVGDHIECIDRAGGKARAIIETITADSVSVRVAAVDAPGPQQHVAITVLPALLPEAKMDFILQKCTEIGVHSCQPVFCARSVVRDYGKGIDRKLARWQRICDEAARQCGGPPMQVSAPLPFAEALAVPAGLKIIADAGGCAAPEAVKGQPAGIPVTVSILIGPEGGFTEGEIAQAVAAGWTRVRFNDNILRAETAAVVCSALVQHMLHHPFLRTDA